VQAGVVVEEDARGDVHGVDQAQPLADFALSEAVVDFLGDVQIPSAGPDLKPKLFTVGFHILKKYCEQTSRAAGGSANVGHVPSFKGRAFLFRQAPQA